MSSDNQFTALGPAFIGFQTNATRIDRGAEITGTVVGVKGTCSGFPGDGVQGFGTGNFSGVAGFARDLGGFGVFGLGKGGAGAGVRGVSVDPGGNGVIAEAHNGVTAYGIWARSSQGLAGRFDGRVEFRGNVLVTGSLTVQGAPKSAAVPHPDGSHRLLYCMESPESWFEDFGVGQLVHGQAQVQLDPDFAAVVNCDAYHVFLTEYDDNNSLYVTARTNKGFGVRAKASTAGSTFSYRVVAKRKDITAPRLAKVSPSTGAAPRPEEVSLSTGAVLSSNSDLVSSESELMAAKSSLSTGAAPRPEEVSLSTGAVLSSNSNLVSSESELVAAKSK